MTVDYREGLRALGLWILAIAFLGLLAMALLGPRLAHAETKIYLVIKLYQPDIAPITVEDEEQRDLPSCWMAAEDAVDKAAKVAGAFEFVASCSVRKTPDDPA